MDTKERIVVNFHVLSLLVETGAFDRALQQEVNSINPNDREELLWYHAEVMVPRFKSGTRFARAWLELLYHNLRYFLRKGEIPCETIWDSTDEPCFELPDDPIQFFICAWAELFPGESYLDVCLDDYVERNDRFFACHLDRVKRDE